MVGICFFFEENDIDVYSGRPIDLDAWNYAAKAAGDVDSVHIINRTDADFSPFNSECKTTVAEEFSPKDLSGHLTYLVPPWQDATQPLWVFDHFTDWYVFGPAGGWPGGQQGVCVPQAGCGALHSVHIASVVLMHRYGVVSWR